MAAGRKYILLINRYMRRKTNRRFNNNGIEKSNFGSKKFIDIIFMC